VGCPAPRRVPFSLNQRHVPPSPSVSWQRLRFFVPSSVPPGRNLLNFFFWTPWLRPHGISVGPKNAHDERSGGVDKRRTWPPYHPPADSFHAFLTCIFFFFLPECEDSEPIPGAWGSSRLGLEELGRGKACRDCSDSFPPPRFSLSLRPFPAPSLLTSLRFRRRGYYKVSDVLSPLHVFVFSIYFSS